MTASPDVEAATALKVKGNAAFTAHDWPTAIAFYTQAIEKNDKDASFFANRAQVSVAQPGARDQEAKSLGRRISS